MTDNLWLWIGFNVFVLFMLALDLGVFHRKAHVVTFKESIAWTVVWVTLALLFNLGVAHYMGDAKGLEFFTGYVIEKSLSVDNVFVFALLFTASAALAGRPRHITPPSGFRQRAMSAGSCAATASSIPNTGRITAASFR